MPEQVTLVPDLRGQLTSNHGWDTRSERAFLQEIIEVFRQKGIRTSIFVDPVEDLVRGAQECGTDRIELYTEAFAKAYAPENKEAVKPYAAAARIAASIGLGINAGHDLNLYNLSAFAAAIPELAEVSIGHALISDAIYYGLQNTIQMYLRNLTAA